MMGNNLRQLACVVALLAFALTGVEAQEKHGKVAILDNDRIIEGDIDRVGDQYRVRRAVGETWLAADKVRKLCATMLDALAYVRTQANLNDPDERLRLARWCLAQGLRTEAVVELEAAADMRPSHAETQRMLRGLQRTVVSEPAPPPPAKEETPEPAAEPVSNIPYNPAALGMFVNKVQPILMNACACCHANNKGGSFVLLRGYDEGKPANRKTTQHNLAAVLGQINRLRPTESPLLIKSLMMHGGADHPPLKSPTAAAYRTLVDWAQFAMTNVPLGDLPVPVTHAPPAAPAPVFAPAPVAAPKEPRVFAADATPLPRPPEAPPAAAPKETPAVTPVSATKPADAPAVTGASWAAQLQAQKAAPAATEFAAPAAGASTPAAPPSASDDADDPFDPVIFNRQR